MRNAHLQRLDQIERQMQRSWRCGRFYRWTPGLLHYRRLIGRHS